MSVRIVVDSGADLSAKARSALRVVPLTLRMENKEYRDGIDITGKEFYERLPHCRELPTTSQATPVQFQLEFEAALCAGESVVVITISSRLSGTHQSACIAAADYDNVFVVDSLSVSVGEGILAEYALHCAGKGMSAPEIAQCLEARRNDVSVIGLLDTLEYLKRGGRISKTAALAGGLLNVKPVLCIEDGAIAMMGRARGLRQGNNLLRERIMSDGVAFDCPVLLGYTGNDDSLLKKYIEDSRALWEGHEEALSSVQVGSVIGTHAGAGAILAAYFRKRG